MKRYISIYIILSFVFTGIMGPCPTYAQDFVLPAPGRMISLSPAFSPVVLKGIKLDPKNPFKFHFFVDRGDSGLAQDALKAESSKLIKYFLAALTIPEKELWVNLSPYEKDRIVPREFGETEMGRDLLAEDYILKQITASLIYPESQLGKEFWNKVYTQAQERYGTTNVPINTFNKVWIVPEKAVVYENGGTAFVLENHLKVMLEEDYLSLQKHSNAVIPSTSELGSQIVREIVIPALTKEVNEGKNFAQLRQVFYSLILATWYKKKIKDSILNKIYSDRKKIQNLSSLNSSVEDPRRIYQLYLQAFKKGVFNYISEKPYTNSGIGQMSASGPRKYFSGGVVGTGMDNAMVFVGKNEKELAVSDLEDEKRIIDVGGYFDLVEKQAMAVSGNQDPTWQDLVKEGYSVESYYDYSKKNVPEVRYVTLMKDGQEVEYSGIVIQVFPKQKVVRIANFYPEFPDQKVGRGRALLRHILDPQLYPNFHIILQASDHFRSSLRKMKDLQFEENKNNLGLENRKEFVDIFESNSFKELTAIQQEWFKKVVELSNAYGFVPAVAKSPSVLAALEQNNDDGFVSILAGGANDEKDTAFAELAAINDPDRIHRIVDRAFKALGIDVDLAFSEERLAGGVYLTKRFLNAQGHTRRFADHYSMQFLVNRNGFLEMHAELEKDLQHRRLGPMMYQWWATHPDIRERLAGKQMRSSEGGTTREQVGALENAALFGIKWQEIDPVSATYSYLGVFPRFRTLQAATIHMQGDSLDKAMGSKKKVSSPKKGWTRRHALIVIGGGVAAALSGVWWLNRPVRWPVNFHFIFNLHASAADARQVSEALASLPQGQPAILFLEGGYTMDALHEFMEGSYNLNPSSRYAQQLKQDMDLIFNADVESLQTNDIVKQRIQKYLDVVNKQASEAGGQNLDTSSEWGQELRQAYDKYKPQIMYEAANADAVVAEAVARRYLSDAEDALLREKNIDKYLALMDKHINAQYESDRLRDDIVSKQLRGIAENTKSETDIIVYRGLYHALTLHKTIEEFKKKAVGVKQIGSLDDTSKLTFDELLIMARIKDGQYHFDIPLDRENALRFFLEDMLLTELPLSSGQNSIKIARGSSGQEVISLFGSLHGILDRLSGAKLDEVFDHVINNPFPADVNQIAVGAYVVEQLKGAGVVMADELQNVFNVVSWQDQGDKIEVVIKDDQGSAHKFIFSKKDQAMNSKLNGGIDLNPAQMSMQVKKDGQDFKFDLNNDEIDAAQVIGATFTIRTMRPVSNLLLDLGLTASADRELGV